MNITLRSRNKQTAIQQGPQAEDIDANLDRLFQDMVANAAAFGAYGIDLAADVNGATSLALARLAGVDVSNTTSFLRRDGTWNVPPNPAGFIPYPASRSSAWTTFDANGLQGVGMAVTSSGVTSTIQDDTGYYKRHQTGAAAGASASLTGNANICRFNHNPRFQVQLRTGATLAAVRIWAGLFSGSQVDSDTMVANKGVAFRYSTVAPDAGWVGVTRDGTTQTVSGQVAAIATSTRYLLDIVVSGNGTLAAFSVNGGPVVTLALGAGILATDVFLGVYIFTEAAVLKQLDFGRVYYERD